MFQFPGFAHPKVYLAFSQVGCPIRKSTDQWVCAPPRSLSQLIASFFASESLGIPHAPFLTFFKLASVGILYSLLSFAKIMAHRWPITLALSAQYVKELYPRTYHPKGLNGL
jgi:hypothetical protein